MTTYTNPSGTFDATDGDDTIIFNAAPADATTTAIDALGGHDSLFMQFDYSLPVSFDVSDWNNSGAFMSTARYGPYGPLVIVYNVESVELHGTSNNDTFHLQIGKGGTSGLTAVMDGGAGQDLLQLDVSKLSTDFSFVVNGISITSSWGTFTNFEKFEIHTGSGNDTITTGNGNDNIYTGTGVDNVSASAGNDSVYSQSTGGTFDGGDGYDYFQGDFSAQTAALSVTIGNNIQMSNGLTANNFESFSVGGGSGDDLFTVTRAQSSGGVSGGAGHDTLVYNAPSTTGLQFVVDVYNDGQLDGHISAAGTSFGFDGLESLVFTGTQFDDTFQISAVYSTSGSDFSFDAGAGIDSLTGDFSHFTGATSIVVAADGTMSSNRGQFANFEVFNWTGGLGADTVVTGSGNDVLYGGTGSDHLDGGAGNDTLYSDQYVSDDDGAADVLIGGLGDDTIAAGFGDTVDGGAGTDKLYYTASSATAGITADFSQLTSGGSITIGGATLTGIEQIAQITATNFNDTIVAGASATSNETIFALAGDDHVTGSSGADTIYGGDGNDIISGGGGSDTLLGGDGNDTFIDTAAGFNGDKTDFGLGDTIVITDADINNFSFSYSGGLLTYAGGSMRVDSQLPGRIVASAAPGGGVQLQVQLPPLASVDQIANELTTGYWNGDTHHFNVTQGGTITVNISTLNATEQTLARAALQEWTDIIGVHFQEVLTGGQIVFDDSEDPSGPIAATDAVWSNAITSSAHVHISSSWVTQNGSGLNSYSFETYIHEVGHALGLGHAGNYNFTATYGNDAMFLNDSVAMSVMSYFDQGENYYFANQHFSILNAVTPMQADIVAMQSLYGLSTTTRAGDTVYGFHSNAGGVYDAQNYFNVAITIFDSGGNDTLDYSNVNYGQLINLNPETFSNVNSLIGNLSIARGTIIENAIGGFGNDTIIGNAVDNVLTGNAGSDTLTGGAGNDTFKDTAAGLNGDTITDFSAGDKILITDASLAGFNFSLSGNTLTYTGGSLTLGSPIHGTIVAAAAAGGGVQLTILPHDQANDFNGDGISDFMWRNDSGVLSEWLGQPNGTFAWNPNAGYQVGTDWSIKGFGDFNGDGRDDILWRQDSTGTMMEWLAHPDGTFAWNVNYALPTSFAFAGIGDFNGDGRDDIMWRDSSGTLSEWLGQGNGAFAWNPNAAFGIDNGWQIVGTGDFNGDGRDDLVWRQTGTTHVMEWIGQSDGTFSWMANYDVATDFHLAATGDFNGDGRVDLMWRDSSGDLSEWLGQQNGGFAWNPQGPSSFGSDWQVAGAGDYNRDGTDDIIWRWSFRSEVIEWLGQSNGSFAENSNVRYPVDPGFHAQPMPLDHAF